jgi:hypothetical protein
MADPAARKPRHRSCVIIGAPEAARCTSKIIDAIRPGRRSCPLFRRHRAALHASGRRNFEAARESGDRRNHGGLIVAVRHVGGCRDPDA